MTERRRLLLIGIDCLTPTILESLLNRGELPTLKSLIDKGCYAWAIPFWCCDTGVNWATIITGASPRVHGCAFRIRVKGQQPDKKTSGFPSYVCKAEQLWVTAERYGRKCIILDYPQSYPINAKNVIHVGEDGCESRKDISPPQAYVSKLVYENIAKKDYLRSDSENWLFRELREHVTVINIKPARNWRTLPPSNLNPLEAIMPIKSKQGEVIEKFHILITSENDKAYDTVYICTNKDISKSICKVRVNEWSNWITHDFYINNKIVPGVFRVKLLKLSPDARVFHLYRSQIYPLKGWSYPEYIADELVKVYGPYLHCPSDEPVVLTGACDPENGFVRICGHTELRKILII